MSREKELPNCRDILWKKIGFSLSAACWPEKLKVKIANIVVKAFQKIMEDDNSSLAKIAQLALKQEDFQIIIASNFELKVAGFGHAAGVFSVTRKVEQIFLAHSQSSFNADILFGRIEHELKHYIVFLTKKGYMLKNGLSSEKVGVYPFDPKGKSSKSQGPFSKPKGVVEKMVANDVNSFRKECKKFSSKSGRCDEEVLSGNNIAEELEQLKLERFHKEEVVCAPGGKCHKFNLNLATGSYNHDCQYGDKATYTAVGRMIPGSKTCERAYFSFYTDVARSRCWSESERSDLCVTEYFTELLSDHFDEQYQQKCFPKIHKYFHGELNKHMKNVPGYYAPDCTFKKPAATDNAPPFVFKPPLPPMTQQAHKPMGEVPLVAQNDLTPNHGTSQGVPEKENPFLKLDLSPTKLELLKNSGKQGAATFAQVAITTAIEKALLSYGVHKEDCESVVGAINFLVNLYRAGSLLKAGVAKAAEYAVQEFGVPEECAPYVVSGVSCVIVGLTMPQQIGWFFAGMGLNFVTGFVAGWMGKSGTTGVLNKVGLFQTSTDEKEELDDGDTRRQSWTAWAKSSFWSWISGVEEDVLDNESRNGFSGKCEL